MLPSLFFIVFFQQRQTWIFCFLFSFSLVLSFCFCLFWQPQNWNLIILSVRMDSCGTPSRWQQRCRSFRTRCTTCRPCCQGRPRPSRHRWTNWSGASLPCYRTWGLPDTPAISTPPAALWPTSVCLCSVCMCVWEREREKELGGAEGVRERVCMFFCVCVYVWPPDTMAISTRHTAMFNVSLPLQCVCVCERERVCVWEREKVCECVYGVCVWERESVCVRERKKVCECVYGVCVWEREREAGF